MDGWMFYSLFGFFTSLSPNFSCSWPTVYGHDVYVDP